jgi:hypothetical protein
MAKSYRYPKCFGPYLRYAISTDFRNFEFFDEKNFKLFFLVEFKRADLLADFDRDMNVAGVLVEFGPADDNSRYVTARTDKSAALDAGPHRVWDKYVSKVELSLPLKPSLEHMLNRRRKLVHRWKEGKPPGSLLIGVLDDGCPFAAAQFLAANGAASTRVRAIWDQDQGKQPVKLNGGVFGQTLSDFNYGLEFQRESVTPGGVSLRQIGLDEWSGLHSTPTGSIDEDSCYADAGFSTLKFRDSHGAHVMDVFAGRLPTSSRIGPSQPGQDRRDPPSWKAATDAACSVDMVFVQFAESCILDATGVWLKAYVFDGIQYILSHADPQTTDNVVINLSYGPTTGPHDGTAELETALTAFVTEFNGHTKKPKLEIVLAAGNSYLTDGHVAFEGKKNQPDVEWTWRLLPDNPVLCFAEVWMKTADAGGVTVSLTSPSGVTFTSTGSATSTVASPPAGVDAPLAWGSDDTMWRLQVEPTIAGSGVVAEHGDWTIKVAGVGKKAEVNAYVARTDPNLGVRTGAKRSYFVDPNWQRTRAAAASCTRVDGEFDNTGSLVSRFGTLNGIATANDSSVHVAGGDILANARKSTYASAGPARSGPLTFRAGPDFALPCDESYALEGIRAGGTRSGIVFRLIGTSAAAPQLARLVTAKSATGLPFPPPTNVPSPNDLAEIEKRGGGDMEPP